MATITINGNTFTGNSIHITGNGTVIVDGNRQDGPALSGVVEVRVVEGVLGSLRSDASVRCGEVRGNVAAGGDVSTDGKVSGNIAAGNNVTCGDLEGSVNAGNNVKCGNVSGRITAGNNVTTAR